MAFFLVAGGQPLRAQGSASVFTLSFSPCPAVLEAKPGTAFELEFSLVLATSDNPDLARGASAWTLSLSAEGGVDVSDAIAILGCKFLGLHCSACPDAGDANDDGQVDIGDPIRLLSHLFLGAPPPPEPSPKACGRDPTEDGLGDCRHDPCRGAG